MPVIGENATSSVIAGGISPIIPYQSYDWAKERLLLEVLKLQPHKSAEAVIADVTKYITFISNKKESNIV